ncbi:hypothetical protein DMH04_15125 [Kibdelosporangium aridum]|uniref:Alpha-amylase n=1 Tax=Kibdelosporangium aridum TaxID=2030 RepID=A0A428ZD58_KIBAR|nr:carboxypeptidase-like regulatory domain-containing protein [Kibdelosporangium aridum]RSM86004.1 hypothetical protein DMH04_15125 [Kibdelosporangium aridum]
MVYRLFSAVLITFLMIAGLAVPAGAADDRGSVAGTFTQRDGSPIAQARVELRDRQDNYQGTAATGADGAFGFDNVAAGDYKLRFFWPGSAEQYYPQKLYSSEAGTVTVVAGQVTTVNETALPTGGLVVTVADDATGAPLAGVCLSGEEGLFECTDAQGKADFGTVRARTYRLTIGPPDGYLFDTIEEAVVQPDVVTAITKTMHREAVLDVSFVDAVTAEPVADACLHMVDEQSRGVVDTNSNRFCTNGTGKIRIGKLWPARIKLYAWSNDGKHGSQWVGPSGGTGDVDAATWFQLAFGATTSVTVKLDGAGSITGMVTDVTTGAPVSQMCPTPTPAGPSSYQPGRVTCTYSEGRYTINGLGPYDWKIQFPDYTRKYGWLWSGNGTNRHEATPVRVNAGASVTLDVQLPPTGVVTGKIIDSPVPLQYVKVLALNAQTGDWAAPYANINVTTAVYTMKGLNNQLLKVGYSAMTEPFWHPQPVRVFAGMTTGNIDLVFPPMR